VPKVWQVIGVKS